MLERERPHTDQTFAVRCDPFQVIPDQPIAERYCSTRTDSVPMEQPRRRRSVRLVDVSPDHPATVARARQRDVEEAHALRKLLLHRERARRFQRIRADVEHRGVPFRGIVKADCGIPFRVEAPVPHEGTEHERKLEALRRVHGQNFDQVFVAFEAQQLLFVPAARRSALLSEPFHGGADPMTGRVAMHELQQMREIGRPALAVGVGE